MGREFVFIHALDLVEASFAIVRSPLLLILVKIFTTSCLFSIPGWEVKSNDQTVISRVRVLTSFTSIIFDRKNRVSMK